MISRHYTRWIVALGGWALLSVLLWFLGPYLAFANVQPFASVGWRVVTVLLFLAFVVIWMLALELLAARRSSGLADAISAQSDAAVVASRPLGSSPQSSEREVLRNSFADAVKYLKREGGRTKDLYRLPWFVIIGPPGAGKTTALKNSGLRFPLEDQFGNPAARGVGGTRNCDWWFAEDAIFLDTAGRFTTQDSDHIADGAAWAEFLRLLRKYRGRRPLNGILLTVSIPELLEADDVQRDNLYESIRRRLHEIQENLKVELPVYVLVTKLDLMAGFSTFFDDLGAEGRKQVWGITFPIEVSERRTALQSFPGEFEALAGRAQDRAIARLADERSVPRRSEILGFPQQVASLKKRLQELLEAVGFGQRSTSALLRGVYFTSGTQEGSPVDRVVASIARGLDMETDSVRPTGAGRAYFIARLLTEVVLPESGLAGMNRRLAMLSAGGSLLGYAAVVLLVIGGGLWMANSYRLNANYIQNVDARLDAALETSRPATSDPVRQIEAALPRLDGLLDAAEFAGSPGEKGRWAMRAGLSQVKTMSDAAYDAYYRELETLLLPPLAALLAASLEDATASPEKLFEYLKGYLMLGDPERLDPDFLRALFRIELPRATGTSLLLQGSLERHVDAWLTRGDDVAPAALDVRLIERARIALSRASIGRLLYSRIRFDSISAGGEGLRLDQASGIGAAEVLRSRTGRSLATPIPPLFTKATFQRVTAAAGAASLVKDFNSERWVLGDSFPISGIPKAVSDAFDLYEADYLETWDRTVKDVTVADVRGIADTRRLLAVISSPTSPLRGFLATVAEQTRLSNDSEAQDNEAGNASVARLEQVAGAVQDIGVMSGIPKAPGARVTRHFQELHALFDGPPGAAPIDLMLQQLAQTGQELATLESSASARSVPELFDQALGRAFIGSQLPDPVASVFDDLVDQSRRVTVQVATSELSTAYQQRVRARCLEIATGRYPFMRTSGNDVPLLDFARLFGPSGVFATFFNEQLAPLVDTSRRPWSFRETMSPGLSAATLAQFERAAQITELYFANSGTPEFAFSLTPRALDPAVLRLTLEVDGQMLEYRHGPQRPVPMRWPGQGSGGAALVLETNSGRRSVLSHEGVWGWFRLLDAARIVPESDTRFRVIFSIDGYSAELVLEAMSIRNPLVDDVVAGFRCGV